MSESKDVHVESSEPSGSVTLPIESAPGETNDMKTQERENDSKPSKGDEAAAIATEAKKQEEKGKLDEALKMTDSEREDKVVKDAVRQITFYLSDSNLPYDKFLFTQSMKDKADDAPMGTGWIPLSTILSFKRMQEITSQSSRSATICEFAIVNALRTAYPQSDEAAMLEVSSDGHDIRRRKELTPPSQTGQMDRSVYVKGFPEEDESAEDDSKRGSSSGRGGKNYSFSPLQKELESWFESLGFGKVNAVRMRRDEHKKFKQSVFVEYATNESAKAFLAMDPKPTYPGQDKAVETMAKKEYVDMKAAEKGITKPEYGTSKQGLSRDNNNNSNNNNKSRPFNAFRDHATGGGDRRREGNARGGPQDVKVFVEGKELEVDQETGKVKNPDEISYQPGKVARFEGVGDSDDANPMELKRSLLGIHPTVFVNYDRGDTSGVVFFKDSVTEEIMQKIRDADMKLGGTSLTWTLIEGEDEKTYHHERAHKRASIALADAKSGGGRDDRSRGGRGGGRGARGGRGRGRGGNDRRGDDRRGGSDRRDRNDRGNDRNEEREKNDKKRGRDDEPAPSGSPDKPKGTSISVPQLDSRGPGAEPPAKKAKTDDA